MLTKKSQLVFSNVGTQAMWWMLRFFSRLKHRNLIFSLANFEMRRDSVEMNKSISVYLNKATNSFKITEWAGFYF